MFQIKQVITSSDWNDFIRLPWKIYRDDPNWVPPLQSVVRNLLSPKKNPFFKHAVMYPLIAYHQGQAVGRIMGIIDSNHNQFHNEKTGFFGFFEAIHDAQLTKALMSEVVQWLKSQGMDTLRGPMNPSVNHECGLLVEGFDDPPSIMMTYNPKYYVDLFEELGLVKAKDLFAYQLEPETRFSSRVLKHAERLREKQSIQLRNLNMRAFHQDLEHLFQMTNEALDRVWGFVPLTRDEFFHTAKDLKSIVDPRLVFIAEYKGKPIGYGLALPDMNQALIGIKSGRLFPLEILKLFWNTVGPGRKKTIKRCRIILLCVKKDYEFMGIGPLLYSEYMKIVPSLGYSDGEASFVVEDNKPMNKALEMMNAKRTKVYRIYEKNL